MRPKLFMQGIPSGPFSWLGVVSAPLRVYAVRSAVTSRDGDGKAARTIPARSEYERRRKW